MDPDRRENCPKCGAEVLSEESTCHVCGASLLVTVVVTTPVADGRVRYQAARSVAALGPPAAGFVPAQQALARAGGVLADGVTRGFASRIAEIVVAAGGQTTNQAAKVASSAVRGSWPYVALASALLVFGGLAVVWRFTGSRAPATAAARASTPAAVAASAAAPTPQAIGVRKLADIGLSGTVALRCSNSVGSGFFVASDLVLTNAHVLCKDGSGMEVTDSKGGKLKAFVLKSDPELDLALVQVPGAEARPLEIGDAGEAGVGDKVVFVGSPMGLDFTVHEGTVSSLSRAVGRRAFIQLDAKVNPGNSGGPLLDASGKVIGIVSAKHAEAEGIGLAIPINYAYTGEARLLAPPAGHESSPAFAAMVAQAEKSAASAPVPSFAEAVRAPALAGASADDYGNLVVHVLRAASTTPAAYMVTVTVWQGSNAVCELKGDATDWNLVTRGGTALEVVQGVVPWAQRQEAAGAQLYLGKATLPWRICSVRSSYGLVLELQDADPVVSKLVLR